LWENLCRSKLSKVAPDAVWTTTWAARQAYSNTPVEKFWKSGFFHINHPLFIDNDPRSTEELRDNAFGFGHALWVNSAWKLTQGAVFTVEVQKGGEEQGSQRCVIL